MAHAAVATHDAPPGSLGVYTQKLGMWVFLCSEVMFFTALIGSYIILRFGSAQSWPRPGDILNIPLTAFNTFVLICSSVSMVKAYAAAVHDDQKGLKMWLCITVLGGAFFVSIQGFEYWHLSHEGFLPMGLKEGSELYARAVAGQITGRRFAGRVAYFDVALGNGDSMEVLGEPAAADSGQAVFVRPAAGGPLPRAYPPETSQ